MIFCLISCNDVPKADDALVRSTLNKYPIARNGSEIELISFVQETDSLLSSFNNPVYNGLNNFIKGSYFNGTSNFKLALKFFSKVENDLIKYPPYDSLRLASYIFLSEVNMSLGNFDESVKQALKAKAGYEKLKIPAGIYAANITMSRMFQAKGEIKKAMEIIKSNTQVPDTNLKLKALHILANIYGEQGDIDSALAIDNEVLSKKEIYPQKYVSPFLNNKALCLNEKKQFDSALYYFKQSLLIDSAHGNLQNMAANYSDMGGMYLNQNDFERAKYYSLKSLDISKTVGRKVLTLYSYKNMYQLYKTVKDYPNAVAYGDSIARLQKELDNLSLNTAIEELNLVYETTKKERKIEQQQDTIERNKILFSGIAALLLFTGLLIYNFYRQNKLKHQLDRVKVQQENEKAIAAAEQKERLRISRDLHDNMGAYTSALLANIEKLKIKNIETPELGKMQDNANHILSSLRETIWILNNKEVSLTDFNDGFKNYCFKVLQNFEDFHFNAEENILVNKKLPAATAIHLNNILQEAVQNSIKHSKATAINYTLTSGNKFEIKISDNGVGFEIDSTKKGNGLDNMEWRAREAGVSLDYQTIPGKGTSILINET